MAPSGGEISPRRGGKFRKFPGNFGKFRKICPPPHTPFFFGLRHIESVLLAPKKPYLFPLRKLGTFIGKKKIICPDWESY